MGELFDGGFVVGGKGNPSLKAFQQLLEVHFRRGKLRYLVLGRAHAAWEEHTVDGGIG